MSNIGARTYSYPVAVTKSDSTNDPAGPFAGLLVTVAGNVVVFPLNGPGGGGTTSMTLAVIAGQELHFPVCRVGSTSTTATVFGLVDSIVQQGFK